MAKKRYYYTVAAGRTPGVYSTWKEVQTQVRHFPNAILKKFTVLSDAEDFVRKKQPASISLSLKEVEASQSITRLPGPPKVVPSKRKLDHNHDDEQSKKKKNK